MNESQLHPENPQPSEMPEQVELSRGEKFTRDLDRINDAIVAMLTDPTVDPAALREAWVVRTTLTEEFVDSLMPTPENPDPRPRVQFDIIVDKALIFERVGDTLRYLSELDTAEGFALNLRLDDLAASISEEFEGKVDELGDSLDALILKLRPHISFENREYLRSLIDEGIDAEDFIGDVYGIILDEGGDPDEVLTSLGVTEA